MRVFHAHRGHEMAAIPKVSDAKDPDALVTQFCEAWTRMDVDELVAYFTDDAVYHNIPMEAAVGRDAIRQLLTGMGAMISAIRFEVPRTETSHAAALPQLYADQFGWEEMVRSVARVYASLPANEQQHAAIFCQNYGEAGAIDFFGPKYGLPPALSGHQNYFYWGPGNYTGAIMIVLDDDATDEREQFRSVEDRGMVESSPWAMPWEQRLHIFVCRDLKIPLRELWPKVRVWL